MPPRKKPVLPPPAVAAPSANTRSSRSKTKAAADSNSPQTQSTSDTGGDSIKQTSASTKGLSKVPDKPKASKPLKEPKSKAPPKKGTQVSHIAIQDKSELAKTKSHQVVTVRTPPAEYPQSHDINTITTAVTAVTETTKSSPEKGAKFNSPGTGKRPRAIVEEGLQDTPPITEPKPKKGRTTQTSKRVTKRQSAFSTKACEEWFASYADAQDPDTMSPEMSNQWLQDLGINEESAAYFVLAWELQAKSMFTLTRLEFTSGMARLGVDSNDKLLHKLPAMLNKAKPSTNSPDFLSFYKFCFEYGKSGGSPGAKNVDLTIATEFLRMVLDTKRYSIDYRPDPDNNVNPGQSTDGEFSHTHAFIEFLKTIQPVKVMNRDQWESFLPFNKSVTWNLEGYSEDGAWPSLFDQYVDWRKSKYPDSVSPQLKESNET